MARLYKKTSIKTRVKRDQEGKPIRLPNGRYAREPVTDRAGHPVTLTAKRWTIEYKDGRGRTRRHVAYSDKAASMQLAAQLEKRAERTAAGMIDDMVEEATSPIEQHVRAYRDHLVASKVTADHVEESTGRLRKILTACGITRLCEIQAAPVERYLTALMNPKTVKDGDEERTIAGRSPRTRNTYLASIRAFVRWAVKDHRLDRNRLENIEVLDEHVDVRRRRRALTDDELQRLVTAALNRPTDSARKFLVNVNGKQLTDDDRRLLGRERALIYKTLAMTGLRIGELRATTWGDIDFDGGWIAVRAAVAKNSRDDSVPIGNDLVDDLTAWWVACGKPAADVRVFTIPVLFCRLLKKDLKAAGIPYETSAGFADVHSLRHTTGTRLANCPTVPTRVAQAVMRHSDIRLTMGTYVDKRLVDRRVALDALPKITIETPKQEGGKGHAATA